MDTTALNVISKTAESALRILIVEDDADDYYLVKTLLSFDESNLYTLEQAKSLSDALHILSEVDIDVILLDMSIQDAKGTHTIQAVTKTYSEIPVIVLTCVNDENFGRQAIQCGAEDYIPKELATTELLSRSITHSLERHRLLTEIKRRASTDALTGLANRSAFYEKLSFLIEQCRRNDANLAAVMIDLDDFKRVNDTLGHQAGDELLKHVAARLTSALRKSDTLARLGGDEFVVLLSNFSHTKDISMVLEKMLVDLCKPYDLNINGNHHNIVVTLSMGIAIWKEDQNFRSFLDNADMAMYQSKKRGKNKTSFYDDKNIRR